MFKINIKKTVFLCTLLLFINNCGLLPSGYMGHSTNTQVILSEANFRTIKTVKGQATANYIVGLGLNNNKLYSRAKMKLLENANLSGGGNKSRALINITTDEEIKFLLFVYIPFYWSKTVYMTADVIEFKES
jgi:hypothetical protein